MYVKRLLLAHSHEFKVFQQLILQKFFNYLFFYEKLSAQKLSRNELENFEIHPS